VDADAVKVQDNSDFSLWLLFCRWQLYSNGRSVSNLDSQLNFIKPLYLIYRLGIDTYLQPKQRVFNQPATAALNAEVIAIFPIWSD
jgi:hypothetical protein